MPLLSCKRAREGAQEQKDRGPKAAADAPEKISKANTGRTSGEDYSLQSVWEKRYQAGVFVEWYCGFDHIRSLFERFVPKDSRVLEIGCGDAPLAWDLRDAGYTGNIISFDFSPTVIRKLSADNRGRLDEGMEFRVLDARTLPFEAGSFDLVVDKGTVDAMLCDKSGEGNARATCREAARVVALGGWFVIVSHVHPSTTEGMELLSETLVPALQDALSNGVGRGRGKETEVEESSGLDTEAFFWSVDVHCGGADGDNDSDVGGHERAGGGGGNGGSDGGIGCRGKEAEDAGGEGPGETGQIGPSAYMVRKVARRHTRASAARWRDQEQEQRAIPIRIHEY